MIFWRQLFWILHISTKDSYVPLYILPFNHPVNRLCLACPYHAITQCADSYATQNFMLLCAYINHTACRDQTIYWFIFLLLVPWRFFYWTLLNGCLEGTYNFTNLLPSPWLFCSRDKYPIFIYFSHHGCDYFLYSPSTQLSPKLASPSPHLVPAWSISDRNSNASCIAQDRTNYILVCSSQVRSCSDWRERWWGSCSK